MAEDDDSQLDELFRTYRDSCPDLEPSAEFMPALWKKIETRRGFSFVFQRFARAAMAACAAVWLLLLALNLVPTQQNYFAPATYSDALLAEHSVETTYYTEAVRSATISKEPSDFRH